jgi:predicted GIY-YIG superfamily endonuclease
VPAVEPWYLYVLRCGDGSLYTGVAKDVDARFAQHAAGKGARYTRGRGPLSLLAKARCRDRGEALRVELAFKALARPEKLLVVRAGALPKFVRKIREKFTRSRANSLDSGTIRTPRRASRAVSGPRTVSARRSAASTTSGGATAPSD